jgi:HipA-like protein
VADELVVLMGGVVAGTLTRLPDARLRFEYDEAYRAGTDPTPLSVSMPVAISVHADDRRRQPVTNFLWGLLPDSEAVLDRWARHFHVTASSPFALLGTPVGADCAGAVAFTRADDLERLLARPGTVRWLGEAEIAGFLRDLRRDSTTWLGRSFIGQFSLAGAQAKTALLHRVGRWGLPSGALPTTHILKPAVVGFDDHDLNEHLCLEAARRAGLLGARSTIATFEGQTAVIVERYDRRVVDDDVVRIHQWRTGRVAAWPSWADEEATIAGRRGATAHAGMLSARERGGAAPLKATCGGASPDGQGEPREASGDDAGRSGVCGDRADEVRGVSSSAGRTSPDMTPRSSPTRASAAGRSGGQASSGRGVEKSAGTSSSIRPSVSRTPNRSRARGGGPDRTDPSRSKKASWQRHAKRPSSVAS